MAKTINRLSALKVSKTTKTGWYADGAGLYLQVSKSGSKSWVYRYEIAGKGRRQGIDPIEHKRQRNADKLLDNAKAITFKECVQVIFAFTSRFLLLPPPTART